LSEQDEHQYRFYREMRRIMLGLALSVQAGEVPAKDQAVAKGLDLLRERKQADPNVPLEDGDVPAAVEAEVHRQAKLFLGLKELSETFEEKGLEFTPMSPDKVYRDHYWHTGYVHGCSVQTPGYQFLFAIPLMPMFHNQYMSLAAGPVPGNLLYVTEDLALILPYGEDPKEGFVEAGKDLWGETEELELRLPGAIQAWSRGNFLYIVSRAGINDEELLRVRSEFEVPAVLVADQEAGTERLQCQKPERMLTYFLDIESDW
jgi:hypothetical protein